MTTAERCRFTREGTGGLRDYPYKFRYDGKFGPLEGTIHKADTSVTLHGTTIDQAEIDLGPAVSDAGKAGTTLRSGVPIRVGDLSGYVSQPKAGLRKQTRAIIVSLEDRTPTRMRWRRLWTLSYERTADDAQLLRSIRGTRGWVTENADAVDVAVFCVLYAAQVQSEAYVTWLP